MKKSIVYIIFLVVSSFVGSSAFAGWGNIKAKDILVEDPPETGSSEEQAEVQLMLKYQDSRTAGDCEMGQKQLSPAFDTLFQKANLIPKSDYSRIRGTMLKVSSITEKITGEYKAHYKRKRPYDSYRSISPCITRPGGEKSYPSSHSSVSMAAACVMAKAFPANSSEILAYGKKIGVLRSVVGVHYPSDVQTGQSIGMQVCEILWQDPEFRRSLGM